MEFVVYDDDETGVFAFGSLGVAGPADCGVKPG